MIDRATEVLITRENLIFVFAVKNFSSKNAEFENDHSENHMLKIGGFFKEKQEWLYRYNRLLFSVHKLVNTLLGKLLLLKGMAAI